MDKGCGCQLGKRGNPCCTMFTREEYEATMDQCAQLTKEQLDLIVLGQIMANIRTDDVGLRSRRSSSERQCANVPFYHHGVRVCRDTFLQLHGIGK